MKIHCASINAEMTDSFDVYIGANLDAARAAIAKDREHLTDNELAKLRKKHGYYVIHYIDVEPKQGQTPIDAYNDAVMDDVEPICVDYEDV